MSPGPRTTPKLRVSAELVDRLQQVQGLTDVDRSLKTGQPQQVISLNRGRANDLGVSTGQLGSTLRVLFNGEKAGTIRTGDKDVDVYVHTPEPTPLSLLEPQRDAPRRLEPAGRASCPGLP
jgi:multidrug efflux pump subunit AcrB